jgi:hypothetical protein
MPKKATQKTKATKPKVSKKKGGAAMTETDKECGKRVAKEVRKIFQRKENKLGPNTNWEEAKKRVAKKHPECK